MPTSKCFHSPLRSFTRLFLLLIAVISIPSLMLLGYYLHLIGVLPLPQAMTQMFSAPAQLEDASTHPHSVVLPLSDPRSTQHFSFPGIRQPQTRSAEDAGLAEDTEVIGVCVEGHARAYSIAALSKGPESHVVNDVFAGQAVSVAYSNTMNCARVFTASSKGAPLDLGVGGWQGDKGLTLQLQGTNYALEDGKNLTSAESSPLPCQRMVHQQTTWGEWHLAHPDTDVYVGPVGQNSNGG